MKRGSVLCQGCNHKRSSRICNHCGYDLCYVKIGWKGKTYRYFYDSKGEAFTLTEAVKLQLRINSEIENKVFDPKEYLPINLNQKKFVNQFKVFLEEKQRLVEKKKMSAGTVGVYEIYYRKHFPPLYETDVREFHLKELQQFANGLNCSHKYAKNIMDCLGVFFRWLQRWGEITEEQIPIFPDMEVSEYRESMAIPYHIQVEQIELMPAEHRDPFWLLRELGLRTGEVCALKIGDIDFGFNRILIQRTYSWGNVEERTKQKKKEFVPLSRIAREICERLSKNRFPNEFLCINPGTKRGYRPAFLRKVWNQHKSINGLWIHEAFRHSTITDWSLEGNAFEVQDLARHSDIRTSKRYVHNAQGNLERIVNRNNVTKIKELGKS